MISSNLAGGDCLNVGCVPSKALIRSARLIREVRNAQRKLNDDGDDGENFGVKVNGDIEIDFPQIMKRMRKLRADIAPLDGHEKGEDIGVDVYQGFGRFVSEDTIEVVPVDDDEKKEPIQLKFKKLAICTGGRATLPSNIPGLKSAPYITNETLFNLTKLPQRMIVLGSGVVALEMAQTFATFGSKVTVLVRSDTLFPRSDVDAGPLLMKSLKESAGVEFLTNAKVTNVETIKEVKGNEEKGDLPLMKLSIDSNGENVDLECECLLVATGRTANVENLNCEAANVAFDPTKGILVDDNARSTTNPNVYSVGDCTADVPRLTHMSGEMAKVVVQNSLFDDDWKLSSLVVPSCMYTEPEFASVGQVSASSDDDDVDIYMASLEHNDRSILDSDREGYAKVFCKKGTGTIVGCSIIAGRAGELINEVTLAMKHGIPLEGIGRNIHCYPTTGESLMSCGLQIINSKWTRLD
jgi:pyruvate/2-oxoglutarate dehydrogenase complex dihydrolipoamide dehydrogenase (E3) component